MAASGGVVWVGGVVYFLMVGWDGIEKLTRRDAKLLAAAFLLAPLNLHVLYFGAQHALLVAEHGEAHEGFKREYEAILAPVSAAPRSMPEDEYWKLKKAFEQQYKALRERYGLRKARSSI